ncbi:hypothetical protein, partial [Allobaculum mucilyticum]|uniref:hypothetical protein n=1 Tax=Allobaculum mucilyticum TaxID=2834459 RepID=UPI001E54EE1B
RKKTRESNDSPGSPLNKNEVLKPQAFEKLVGIKTSTKFRAPLFHRIHQLFFPAEEGEYE